MNIRISTLGAAFFLVACGTSPVPDSNPERGVGFGTPDQFVAAQQARRDAELMAMRAPAVPEEQAIAAETMTALNIEPEATRVAQAPAPQPVPQPVTTVAAVAVQPVVTAPAPSPNAQNFDAVATREPAATDADRLARNADQRQTIQPVALPQRSGTSGPNIVAYALETNHPIGTPVHRRSGRTSPERFSRVCLSYGTDDQAQAAFLANGGPERDRKGVDPDGDGYACDWNPTPYRMARGG